MTPDAETRARLAALHRKGAASAPATVADFDWSRRPRPPAWMPRALYAAAVAHLHLGEAMTRRACEALAAGAADPLVGACLAVQARDEGHHAAIYGRYLALLGAAPGAAPAPVVAETLAAAIDPARPLATLLAYNTLLESEALGIQAGFETWLPCPLFRAINGRIARDEARHVAFGRLVLPPAVAALDPAARRDLYHWLRGLWWSCAEAVLDGYRFPGMASGRIRRRWLDSRWARRHRALAAVGLAVEGANP
ncbi:MAG: hypothetical protein H6907_02980 [Hyphomicrobiales bacterium]|nr:hypothetical protein [Hyphomicrobiales bacterium]MCP5370670.1 hypothetical protein [Hyphomicrobiales bacterium]